MPKSVKSSQGQQGNQVPYVTAKSLHFNQICTLGLPHVQCIGIIGEPRAQLELGFFYSSKGGGEGFLSSGPLIG